MAACQLGVKDPSPLILVRQIEPNVQIESAFPDQSSIQTIVEVRGGDEDQTGMFTSIVDTPHQPSGRGVITPCCATRVVTVSELLSLCAQGVNLVNEQDGRAAC